MLGYSAESQRLVSTFMTYRNDIDVYTEDEEKDKEFYRALLKKIIDPKIKINDVTPLGSKSAVIERCNSEVSNGRKKLFIVDGDINLVSEKINYSLKNLYIHDAYCIENLLIDKETITNFIYIQCATKAPQEIENELDYHNWLVEYASSLVDLFIHFAIIDSIGLAFKLGNAYKYHEPDGDSFLFNKNLVANEIENLKLDILSKIEIADYQGRLDLLRSKWENNELNLMKIVSGKDYLIPILIMKTLSFKKSKSKPSLQEIKMLLLHFSNLKRFDPLKAIIEAL